MNILIDSDVLIEVLRGRDEAIVTRWTDLEDSADALLCSPVSVAELWQGARPKEYDVIERLFSALICVPIESGIGRRAGEYMRQFRKSHHVELGDALIAATAWAHAAALWTRNRKHYPAAGLAFY